MPFVFTYISHTRLNGKRSSIVGIQEMLRGCWESMSKLNVTEKWLWCAWNRILKKNVSCLKMNDEDVDVCVCCWIYDEICWHCSIWTSACCQSQPHDIPVLLFWSMWCKKKQSCALMTASVICFIFSTQSLKRSIRRIPYSKMGHCYLAIAHCRHSESKAVLRFMAHVHQQAIQWTKVFRLGH